MSLSQCPKCGQTLSEPAETCPNCGYPIRRNSLPRAKRILGVPTKEKLEAIYHYAVVGEEAYPITIDRVERAKDQYRIHFAIEDKGMKRSCLFADVDQRLFETIEEAEAFIARKYSKDKSDDSDENPELYVLRSNGQYIIDFHENRLYESVMSGYTFHKKSSGFVKVQVPTFGNLSSAQKLYSRESAEEYAKELSEQLGYPIEAVRLLDARNGK